MRWWGVCERVRVSVSVSVRGCAFFVYMTREGFTGEDLWWRACVVPTAKGFDHFEVEALMTCDGPLRPYERAMMKVCRALFWSIECLIVWMRCTVPLMRSSRLWLASSIEEYFCFIDCY